MAFSLMNARADQVGFVNALLFNGDTAVRRQLAKRLLRAEWEVMWSRRFAVVLLLVSLSCFFGLSYVSAELGRYLGDQAILLFELAHLVATISLVGVAFVLPVWMWRREVLSRAEEDSRRFILGLLDTKKRRSWGSERQNESRVSPRRADYLQLSRL